MPFDRRVPYNDLPLLPPANVELETKAVLKRAIGASRALAELKGAGGAIPDQMILLRSIVLQEARMSSEIENIVTTNDAVYRALSEAEGPVDPNAKEVLRYHEALWKGMLAARERPLSTNVLIECAMTITPVHR